MSGWLQCNINIASLAPAQIQTHTLQAICTVYRETVTLKLITAQPESNKQVGDVEPKQI